MLSRDYTMKDGSRWSVWADSEPCPIVGQAEVREHDGLRLVRPAQKIIDSALATQEGGSHYKDQAIQPVEYIHANRIGYFEGNVIKYVSRWKSKGGIEDLKKAKHYIELLIELELRAPVSSDTVKP